MKSLYKVLRAVLMTTVVLAVVVPTLLYVALSMPFVQNIIRERAEVELGKLLDADVVIGDLGIRPFNRAVLRHVAVVEGGDTVLRAERIGAGINLMDLIGEGKINFNYAELIGLDVAVSRDSLGAPLNIQPIIDKLSSKDENKPPTRFRFSINNVVIRQSNIAYDVKNLPVRERQFDPHHIAIKNLRADVILPMMENENFDIDLRRLAFAERSGFRVDDFHGMVHVGADCLSWKDMELDLPGSRIIPSDLHLPLQGLASFRRILNEDGIDVGIAKGSYVHLPSLAAFAPQLGELGGTMDLNVDASLRPGSIGIGELKLSDRDGAYMVSLSDCNIKNYNDKESLEYNVGDIEVAVGQRVADRLMTGGRLFASPRLRNLLGDGLRVKGSASGSLLAGVVKGNSDTDGAVIDIDASYSRRSLKSPVEFDVAIVTENVDLRKITARDDLGVLNSRLNAEGTVGNGNLRISAAGDIDGFEFRRQPYDKISFGANYDNGSYDGNLLVYDNAANIEATFSGSVAGGEEWIVADVKLTDVDAHALNLIDSYPGYKLSAGLHADFNGALPDRADGELVVSDLRFDDGSGERLYLDRLTVMSEASQLPRNIKVSSDLVNGEIVGDFKFATLGNSIKKMFYHTFGILAPRDAESLAFNPLLRDNDYNEFDFHFIIDNTERLAEFFHAPVSLLAPMTIEGNVDSRGGNAIVYVDAPYIRQKNKLIESSTLTVSFDGDNGSDKFMLGTVYPMREGMMDVVVTAEAKDNTLDTELTWKIDRARRYDGRVSMLASMSRDESGEIVTDIGIKESMMAFNDSVWYVHPASVLLTGTRRVDVDDINVSRQNQYVKINGTASESADDVLVVDLLNINLDDIFESLGIEAVMLGGDATGRIDASALMSSTPRIETDGIKVTDISYNKCVFGDGLVKSHWDMDKKAVVIDGTLFQTNGKIAKVEGDIYPLREALDLHFIADDTPVAFMYPYMKAFASDISGRGTGHARLYGTFSDIDMEGKLAVEDLRLKLNFTNTYYTASDTITINPGSILLDDITLYDAYGHAAKLNGEVTHHYFRDARFDVTVSDAKGMLVYDESPKDNPDWYGRIYVNGGARVVGGPGLVTIDVDAVTTQGSIFTFVLSDMEVADEYTFLAFRDKSTLTQVEEEVDEDSNMGIVNRLKEMRKKNANVSTTDYVIELRVDITPEAEIDLLMDPVAGDRIKSFGSGNLRMVYKSKDNDLQMFGTYTLERGTYNFTLQDIIIKDFSIDSGSEIAFTGDPLRARLDIRAIYSLNANLSDLDESFLQDKELNRTNVPVHAVLLVTGDIQEPEINFDLEFPTLTSDTYRKVRSIISTDDMMNRQIIYLLALNRFYTPDYMGSTTKGNELFSVASSTISSQLTNMLGRLSDKFAIAPNLRSDRGDFSDVEVDVALSSRLLNNRLLLNGNFGYRDKSLNNNQFIGDFDIEYLLNRAGSIRLKAYSHYNDENYYLRTAATTQGVGVMYKRDFDDMFSFLRRKPRVKIPMAVADSIAPVDSIAPIGKNTAPTDSIAPVDSMR